MQRPISNQDPYKISGPRTLTARCSEKGEIRIVCLIPDAITQPVQEERSRYPAAYASSPDGALLERQFLLLLAEAHLASPAPPQPPARVGPSPLPSGTVFNRASNEAHPPSVADATEMPPGPLTPSRASAHPTHQADQKYSCFRCAESQVLPLEGQCDLLSL